MELIEIKDGKYPEYQEACYECCEQSERYIFLDASRDGKSLICLNCQIKAILLTKPIKFDKELIVNWIKQKLEEDYESCAQEGLSGEQFLGEIDKFMMWVKPFLEGKE